MKRLCVKLGSLHADLTPPSEIFGEFWVPRIFDEIFDEIFDKFYDQFFGEFLTYNVLSIASFRMGVPLIFFF